MGECLELFAGVDVGTQGVRVIVVGQTGDVVARVSEPFKGSGKQIFEQSAMDWWKSVIRCFGKVRQNFLQENRSMEQIKAISVTSTSGTLLAVDDTHQSLIAPLMYNDPRAETEAEICNTLGAEHISRLGYRFNASYSLPKILWLKKHTPHIFEKAKWFLHPADYLTGKLTGEMGISDQTNVLKMGYFLDDDKWGNWLETDLGIPINKLPQVNISGTVVGTVSPQASVETGLSTDTLVTAGKTDGCASQVATGAVCPGQWASVIGTTLVLKGVSEERIADAHGQVYNHRHPEGYWLPGGASNTGGRHFRSCLPFGPLSCF